MGTLRDAGIVPYSDTNPAPTLRDAGIIPAAPVNSTPVDDIVSANGMGQLRRGFVSAGYGVDADRARAEELSLRASGDIAAADERDAQVRAFQQRAAAYAPAQQDVTNLRFGEDGGFGRALDYGLGTVGSVAGGMVDPIGAGVALGGAGRLVSAIPNPAAKLVGGALQLAGPAAAYGLNNRQQVGEAGNAMVEDEELMRTTTPQQRNTMANITGGIGAIADTALPYMVTSRLIGRPGLKSLAGVPVGLKVLGDSALEAGTEVGQDALKKYGLTQLNPNRDTSGDMRDYINDAAGGFVGSGGISIPSQIVAAGYKRLGVKGDGDVGDKLTDKDDDSLETRLVKRSLAPPRGVKEWADRMRLGDIESNDNIDDVVAGKQAMISKELAARVAGGDTVAAQYLDEITKLNASDMYDDTARDAAYTYLVGTDNDSLLKAYRSRVTNSQTDNVSASDLGAGVGKDGVDARNPAVRATAVERQIIKQRGELATSVMTDAVTNPKPQYKYLAANLAEELAEFGSAGFKNPTQGDYARVQRMAAQFVGIYGPAKAKAVLDEATKASGVAGTPLHKSLSSLIDVAKKSLPQFERTQYAQRQQAADQLVAVIPPEIQTKLRKKGVDLTNESTRENLLHHTELYFDRAQNAPKRIELTAMFGEETLAKMKDVVGQPILPRANVESEVDSEVGEDSKPREVVESDEVGVGEEDNAAREKQMAEKGEDRAPGTRAYFYKGKSYSADGATAKNPFVLRRGESLPTISSIDDENFNGLNTLVEMKNKALEVLGFEPTDRSDDQFRPRGRSKDGRFNVDLASVRSVMDYHGADESKRISVFADYVKKDGVTAKDIERMKELDSKIEALTKTTPKIKITAGALRGNPEYKALQALKTERKLLATDIADAADIQSTAITGKDETGADVRERGEYYPTSDTTLADLADAFFADRFIIVADELGGKDSDRMALSDFRDMVERGDKDIRQASNLSQSYGKKDTPQREAGRMAVEADMNLIRFKTQETKSKNDVAVRAVSIVQWFNRNKTEFEERKVNSPEDQAKEFRNSLLSGIAAMRAEGFMVGAPYMISAEGKVESFSRGIPPSLRLGTLTQKEINERRKKRVAERPAYNSEAAKAKAEANAEQVEIEQNAESEDRNTESDELLPDPREVKPVRGEKRTERYVQRPSAEPMDELQRRTIGSATLGPVGKEPNSKRLRVPKYTSAPETSARLGIGTDDDTQLDIEQEQRDGVPTDRTETRNRTSELDTVAKVPTLTRANAFTNAKRYADQLLGALGKNKAEGLARVQRVSEMLTAPEFAPRDSTTVVGGSFYAAPLAELLTPTNVKAFPELAAIRAKVAGFIYTRTADFSGAQRLMLAKKMNGDAALAAAQTAARQTGDVVNPAEYTLSGSALTINGAPPFLTQLRDGKFGKALPVATPKTESAERALTKSGLLNEKERLANKTREELTAVSSKNKATARQPLTAKPEPAPKAGPLDALPKHVPGQATMRYAGIGSRNTPPEIMAKMTKVAAALAKDGYTLYSGGARGADLAFEAGAGDNKQIFRAKDATPQTENIAREVHPNPAALGPIPLKLMARNAFQVFGKKLDSPVDFVLAWTPDGAETSAQRSFETGGTGQAIDLASRKGVPVINLAQPDWPKRIRAIVDAAKKPSRVLNEQTEADPAVAQSAAKASPSPELIAAAKAYVAKVLGPKVKTEFIENFDAAGEWIKAEDLIKFSLTGGPGLLTVAHHEAMHAFWDRLIDSNPAAAKALSNTMSSPKMLMRLNDLLQGYPVALASIADGAPNAQTERVAYAFQFWAAGLLDVDKPATTMFAKFKKLLRKVFGMVRESETALDIMTAFHEGKLAEPSAAGLVIDKIMKEQTFNQDTKRKFDGVIQGVYTAIATSNDVLRNEKLSVTAQALARTMFTNPGEGSDGMFAQGYLNARRQMTAKFSNYMYATIKGLSERDMAATIEALQQETELADIKSTPVRESVKKVRGMFGRFHTYATEDAGMELKYLGDKYFPRIWSTNELVQKKDEFVAMLLQPKYAKVMKTAADAINAATTGQALSVADVAGLMHQDLMAKNGVDEEGLTGQRVNEILTPFFASQKERSYKWLDKADVAPFLEKDLVGAMSSYIHQGVRAAEFERRFGKGGYKLKELVAMKGDMEPDGNGQMVERQTHGTIAAEMVESIAAQGIKGKEADEMLARHMQDVKNSVQAHEGSLGRDISPAFRKLTSAAMAYQNLRLLPLAMFSAFGDSMGLYAQTGDFGKTFDAFTTGLKDVWARWKDAVSDVPAERQLRLEERIAEAVGAVDSNMYLEQMGNAHTSEFMTDFARKLNRKLFVANGLTAWDRSMRVSATKFAVSFLEDHASLPDKKNSVRWLADLGLEAKDIPLDADGKLIWDRHVLAATRMKDGMTDAQKSIVLKQATDDMKRVHYAIVRWSEASILTPTAGQRPTWASDPHYAVLFHLKQFTYSFQNTIMKRAFNEMTHGNMTPIGALAATVPLMIASDIVKGLAMNGGSLPDYQARWGLADWLQHGFSRAGLGGVTQFGVDALRDPVSLFGPTVDQIVGGAYDLASGNKSFGEVAVDATPGVRMFKSTDFVRGAV